MRQKIHSIVLKVVGHCNINCKYCYIYNHEDRSYLDRVPVLSTATLRALTERINQYCDGIQGHRLGVVFHGGEPTLIGPSRFQEFARILNDDLGPRLKSLAIQTNATLINDEWIDAFHHWNVSVGVSLDGPPQIHDRFRVDHQGRGTQARTLSGIERLQRAGFDPGILSVVNPGEDGLAVYRYFRRLGLRWMDFLLPDVSHDNVTKLYGHHGATPVADYLLPIFDAWFAEDDSAVVIRIFHDLLQRLMGGPGDHGLLR
ncbi:radical SAM protein [Sinorhizobium meliloti]